MTALSFAFRLAAVVALEVCIIQVGIAAGASINLLNARIVCEIA